MTLTQTSLTYLILAVFNVFCIGKVASTSLQDRKAAIIQKCVSESKIYSNTTVLHINGSELAITTTLCPELAQLNHLSNVPRAQKGQIQNMCTQPCQVTCVNSGSGLFPQFDTCNIMVQNLNALPVTSQPFFVPSLGSFSVHTTSAAGACTAVFINPTAAALAGCYAGVLRGIFQIASTCFEFPPNTETEGLCTPTAANQQWEIYVFGEPIGTGND